MARDRWQGNKRSGGDFMSLLFSTYQFKNLSLKNRIVMSPMCMYSCPNKDGQVMNWHKTHYTSRAVGQVGLIILEASAVTPQGRISEQDLGVWSDEHVQGLSELVTLVHEHDAKIGIQIAHAGRKSEVTGPIIAPSAIKFNEHYKTPLEMNLDMIKETVAAFGAAAKRSKEAGFDCLEIHGAHGYLISEFLSPLTNQRTDEYGGSAANRYRFLHEVIEEVRKYWTGPLLVRVSSSDYHPDGNTIDDMIYFAKQMKKQHVDLIDCSSGGIVPAAIQPYPGYQVPFAEALKREAEIATGAVGLITSSLQAEEILQNKRADLIFLGRELLRNPYWPRSAAEDLGISIPSSKQYDRAW